MKRLRTNASNLKSHLRKTGYILRAETIQSTCVQSSSINYHTVIQNGKWKLATKENKSFTHWRLDTYFLITLKDYYYQKLRNIYFFSSSHCILWHFIWYFSCFSSKVSFILHFAWVSTWEKNPKPINRGKTQLQCQKSRLVQDLKLFQHLLSKFAC